MELACGALRNAPPQDVETRSTPTDGRYRLDVEPTATSQRSQRTRAVLVATAAITQGSPAHHWQFGDMAPVAGLDDDEIDTIITYIREQQDLHGFEPYPPE